MVYLKPVEFVLGPFQNRVFKTTYQGIRCYVKLPPESKPSKVPFWQRCLFTVMQLALSAPPTATRTKNPLRCESYKLRELRSLGLNVPEIYVSSRQYLIMEDCGQNLIENIRTEPYKTQYYLEMAIRELGKFHYFGQCHGEAQIENFTVKAGQVYLIDFEADTNPESFENIFVRDLVLFFLSTIHNGIWNFSLPELLSVYEASSGIPIANRLRRLAKWGLVLEALTQKPFAGLWSQEMSVFVYLLKQIREFYH